MRHSRAPSIHAAPAGTRLIGDLQNVCLLDVLQHSGLGSRLVVPEHGAPVDVDDDAAAAALQRTGGMELHVPAIYPARWIAKTAVGWSQRAEESTSFAAVTAVRMASAVEPAARPRVPVTSTSAPCIPQTAAQRSAETTASMASCTKTLRKHNPSSNYTCDSSSATAAPRLPAPPPP